MFEKENRERGPESESAHLTPEQYNALPDGTKLFDFVTNEPFNKGDLDVDALYGDRYQKYPVGILAVE